MKTTVRLLTLAGVTALALGLTFTCPPAEAADSYPGKKLLHVDSYHEDYLPSRETKRGIQEMLKTTGVEYRVVYMDTKRNPSDEFGKAAALKVKEVIESWKPDVVVAADDPASKFLVVPYYKNATLPIVFCGVNWDATPYGYPFSNVTGQVEVDNVKSLIEILKGYAKGARIGYLTAEDPTQRKDFAAYSKVLGIDFTQEAFVPDVTGFKAAFAKMQNETDAIVLGNISTIKDLNKDELAGWLLANGKVPTGTINEAVAPFAMIGLTKVNFEFGAWSARTALKILGGALPSSIAISRNEQGSLYLNVKLATKAGVIFKPELLKNAKIIN